MNPTDPYAGTADPNAGQPAPAPEAPVAETPAPEAPVAETPAPTTGEVTPEMGGDQNPASSDANQGGQNPAGGMPV